MSRWHPDVRGRGPRVAYVLPIAPDGRSPLEALHAWPDTTRLLAALRDAGARPVAVWRTAHDRTSLVWQGITHHFVPSGRSGAGLAAAVRATRPDVVHVNSFLYPVATAALRVACPRARLLVQHHGEPPASGGRLARAQRAVGLFVDAVAFTGAADQVGPWRDAGVVRRRTAVCEVLEAAPAVEACEVDEARRRTGMHGDPAVVWVGRLIAGKDPVTAVHAFAEAFVDRPGARLWMVCTNRDLEPVVTAAIVAAGVAGRVHLVGPVPHDEVGAWLSGADVVLSTSHREGSGYALMEALACGCTPVVSDLGPHRAIVGPLGGRFAVGDGAAAARALATTVPVPRATVRAHAAANLSWAAVAGQLLAAYDDGRAAAPRRTA